jgi:DNA-binding NarL/FixJ family response regulator
MDKIRIIVVDDHPIFRQGVVDTLSIEDDLEIIGEATTGETALAMIRETIPDIAILDINLPDMNGQQIAKHIIDSKLPIRIILLTAYDQAEQVIHAANIGANAYCSKDIFPEKLIEIIHAIMEKNYFFNNEVLTEEQLNLWISQAMDNAAGQGVYEHLTFQPLSKREMQVLQCVTSGNSNKEIAQELNISHQTVKNHVTAILRKLDVDDRTQAAVFAIRQGWVNLNQVTEDLE